MDDEVEVVLTEAAEAAVDVDEADDTLTMAVMEPAGGARTPSIDMIPEASDWRRRGSDFLRNGTRYGCGLKQEKM